MRRTWQSRLQFWLNSPSVKSVDKRLLQSWQVAQQARAFSQEITMNSSGWRRERSLGSDFFNPYTVKQIVLAWLQKLAQTTPHKAIIVLADNRQQSQATKQLCIDIAHHCNLKAYTTSATDRFAPTPFLTFLLQKGSFAGGIMITASHCHKSFNGLKLFNANGKGLDNQQIYQLTQFISANYQKLLDTPIPRSLTTLQILASHYKSAYQTAIRTFLQPFAAPLKKLPVFFSALHGVAHNWTNTFLTTAGFTVINATNQNDYDSQFRTLTDLNPENDRNFQMLRQQAQNYQVPAGALMILNDCDADRVRVGVYDQNQWKLCHGNEIATILVFFLVDELKRTGIVYRTWVSSPLIDRICNAYQQKVILTETGPINLAVAYFQAPNQFLFAFEESLGYLPSFQVNCYKDGIFSAQLIAEVANYLLIHKRLTLFQYLQQIYARFGFFAYHQLQYHYLASNVISKIWQQIRLWTKIADYQITKRVLLPNPITVRTILIEIGPETRITLRYSTTEAILKVYLTVAKPNRLQTTQKMVELVTDFETQFRKILQQHLPS